MAQQKINTNYRPDLDGLRSIAVLMVIAFHFFPGKFHGGFIGVDVFFVISGFLISSILFKEFSKDSFSYKIFYTRRILRIFPALSLVLLTTIAVGWFLLANGDYASLGKHVMASVGFVANILLLTESGYFDSSAIYKPLLHIWSLGVEEQFYLVWPILIAIFWKNKRYFLFLTFCVAIASFYFNIMTVKHNQTIAFYSPLSRFWELMIGGWLAYFNLKSGKTGLKFPNVASPLGFALIIYGFCTLNDNSLFPGYWALLPCVGSFLILSSSESWLNKKVLAHPILVNIGLISYPLYLWHWPLLSLATISISSFKINTLFKAFLLMLTFLLSWLTYVFVEKPLRYNEKYKYKITIGFIAVMVFIGGLGYVLNLKQGFPERFGSSGEYMAYFNPPLRKYVVDNKVFLQYRDDCNFFDVEKTNHGINSSIPRQALSPSCYTKRPGSSAAVFIWGDSHAQALAPGLANTLPASVSLLQVASSGCAPKLVSGNYDAENYCEVANVFAMGVVKREKPEVVILAQYKAQEVAKVRVIAKFLKDNGVKYIIMVGPDPSWEPPLYKIIATQYWDDTPQRISSGLDQTVFQEEIQNKKDIKTSDHFVYVSLLDLLCDKNGCLTYLGDDKKQGITTWDYGHLTPIASTYIAQHLLTPLIESELATGRITRKAMSR